MRRFLSVAATLAVIAIAVAVTLIVPFGPRDLLPDVATSPAPALPLDPTSPWPKFRANALQNGRSPVVPAARPGDRPWSFKTGRGVFSSPVVDSEGTVYVGSADQNFYALRSDGTLLWHFVTGGVIDSSALLDAKGRVIFGAGDGRVYALDRKTGHLVWTFEADSPAEAKRKYQLDIHNVGWFEGNIGLLADGTVLAPNDNQLVYALDPDTGRERRVYRGNEMVWSLPAVDTRQNRFYFATQNLAFQTVFAYGAGGATPMWTTGNLGSVAASLLLTSSRSTASVVGGAFDGTLRAWESGSGKTQWEVTTRDHLYASPAQLSTGVLVQPSADGTVYGISPDGKVLWTFDTGEPLRSSPAVDANDQIYFGGGDGRLFCLNADGTFRWSWLCAPGDRNDLNSSPALSRTGVVIGAEDGSVTFVPYDYPLSAGGRADERSRPSAVAASPGAELVPTLPFGSLTDHLTVAANQSVTLSLVVHEGGRVVDGRLDPARFEVSAARDSEVRLSADGRFVTLVPHDVWTGSEGGEVTLKLTGTWITDGLRVGLKSWGGRDGGRLDQTVTFTVRPRDAGLPVPYAVPQAAGQPATRFALSRLAAPQPTMLPSWNQIGFDSLHYVAGVIAGTANRALVWVVGARLDPATGGTVVDPSLEARFPLTLTWDSGLVTLENRRGFLTNFVGSWAMPFGSWRIAARADSDGTVLGPAKLDAVALADQIAFYGLGLKLLGLSNTNDGHLTVAGGLDWRVLGDGPTAPPKGAGEAHFAAKAGEATATLLGSTLRKSDHNFSLVLVDSGFEALPLDYTGQTKVTADASGVVTSVSITWKPELTPQTVTAWYLVDALGVASSPLQLTK